ncbi:MAG: prepilin peptidase [Candidatus Paceibacterota bacterium]|jgi:prepilin signal peptidase PulO-like enzyme (type II secretory pathway)
MTFTISFVFFIFGLIIGSFLNVVIFRFNTGKSFGGRSKCLHCSRKLSPIELIPLFSFLFLKGRCRGCKTRISFQYPLVEFITGLVFAGLFSKLEYLFYYDISSFIVSFTYFALFFSLLLSIAVYDIKHKMIPDSMVYILGFVALIGIFLFEDNIFFPHIPSVFDFLRGIFFAFPFALLWFVSRGKWIGFGDAKLALGLGWFFSVSEMLSVLLISFWLGAVIGLVLILFKKINKGMKSEIPLVPFLALGTIIVFFFNINIYEFLF